MGFFKSIKLYNFRNFDKFSIDFSKNCNVFYGNNGSGKTNLLEAISLFSKGRGLRKDKISNFIKHDCEEFQINSEFCNSEIIYNLFSGSKIYNNKPKKIISVNNDKTKETLENIYNLLPFLFFVPDFERLFVSSPSNRRNFIDQFIFSYDSSYNKLINQYNKFIQERSNLLLNNKLDEIWLEQLEKKISEYGIKIYRSRANLLSSLIENLNIYLRSFNLNNVINVKLNDSFYEKHIDLNKFQAELKKNRTIDSYTGGSKIGPHKSDFIFFLNKDYLVSQLSTGQQKTLILLIYLSHCKFIIDVKKKQPILLLDEICSHLDDINRKILLTLVESFDLQIFMTGTNQNLFSFLSTNTNFCNIKIR